MTARMVGTGRQLEFLQSRIAELLSGDGLVTADDDEAAQMDGERVFDTGECVGDETII